MTDYTPMRDNAQRLVDRLRWSTTRRRMAEERGDTRKAAEVGREQRELYAAVPITLALDGIPRTVAPDAEPPTTDNLPPELEGRLLELGGGHSAWDELRHIRRALEASLGVTGTDGKPLYYDREAWQRFGRGVESPDSRITYPGHGSSNHGMVFWTGEYVIGDPGAAEWLTRFYQDQNDGTTGHMIWEANSTNYGGEIFQACGFIAWEVAKRRGDDALREAIEEWWAHQLVTLIAAYDPTSRTVVSAACRAAWPTSDISSFIAAALTGLPTRPAPRWRQTYWVWKRLEASPISETLARQCRNFIERQVIGDEFRRTVESVRMRAVTGHPSGREGGFVIQRFNRGHVSYCPEGAWCYGDPQLAAVVVNGEVETFNPGQSVPGEFKAGELGRAWLEDGQVLGRFRKKGVAFSAHLPPGRPWCVVRFGPDGSTIQTSAEMA